MTDEVELDGATPPQLSDDLSFEDAVEEGESAKATDKSTVDKIAAHTEAGNKESSQKESSQNGEPKPSG